MGDCASGYQGDVSNISNAVAATGGGASWAGGVGRCGEQQQRSATTTMRGSVLDEEVSRMSEESLNSGTDVMDPLQQQSLTCSPQSVQRDFPHHHQAQKRHNRTPPRSSAR